MRIITLELTSTSKVGIPVIKYSLILHACMVFSLEIHIYVNDSVYLHMCCVVYMHVWTFVFMHITRRVYLSVYLLCFSFSSASVYLSSLHRHLSPNSLRLMFLFVDRAAIDKVYLILSYRLRVPRIISEHISGLYRYKDFYNITILGLSIMKIRRSHDRIIFITGIHARREKMIEMKWAPKLLHVRLFRCNYFSFIYRIDDTYPWPSFVRYELKRSIIVGGFLATGHQQPPMTHTTPVFDG